MEKQFLNYVKNAHRVLITSHFSPDPDAVCSALLLGETLELNFPDKGVVINLEEAPDGLEFLDGYEKIMFQPINQILKSFKPDLLIMVDTNNYDRCSRKGASEVRAYIDQNQTKTVIIDHHEPANKDASDVYINHGSIAAVQEVYEVCFESLNLQRPKDYAKTTMLGLFSDSNSFVYTDNKHRQTFKLVSDLIDQGVSLEETKKQLTNYSEEHIKVIGELGSNTTHAEDYTYSFINDDFIKLWLKQKKSITSLNTACKLFIDQYIRNIDNRSWGFVVYRDLLAGEAMYGVSLRSIGAKPDVSLIAAKMGGGGHKAAAGAKIKAKSVEDAIAQVKSAVKA